MKASRCLTALTATVLLVQCAMPPQQAWRYIQSNGLLPYLSTAGQPSPPFRSGGSAAQRYAYQRSITPYRSYSGAASPSGYAANRYFSPPSSNSGASRYVPRVRPSTLSRERNPHVRMPVEEPAPSPKITHTQPSASPAPKTNGSAGASAPAPTPTATDSLPYGSAVPGRQNMVNSPYAGKTQLVDVSGMSAGQTVKCPYTGKLFKVPPTQQAANHAEPRLEPKIEAPKISDEPKDGDKKP